MKPGEPVAGELELDLRDGVVTCPGCGRRNYHLEDCWVAGVWLYLGRLGFWCALEVRGQELAERTYPGRKVLSERELLHGRLLAFDYFAWPATEVRWGLLR